MTSKQTRFVAEYLLDLNAKAAAERAGYSPKTAYSIGHKLATKHPEIVPAIQKAIAERAQRTALSADWVLERLRENHDRHVNVKGGGMVVNRALELIGKHLGAFPERIKIEDLTALSDAELAAIAAGRASE